MFFETYLEEGKKEFDPATSIVGLEPIASKTIFERDDSPTEAIEQRSKNEDQVKFFRERKIDEN